MNTADKPYDNAFKEVLKGVQAELGAVDFVFCWVCTAKAFGVKPIPPKSGTQSVDTAATVKLASSGIAVGAAPAAEKKLNAKTIFSEIVNIEIEKLEEEIGRKESD
jgi:hypothetical protein